MSPHLLDVQKLNVYFNGPSGPVHAVRDATFILGHERLGVVGESGSGKSAMAKAILRLPPGRVEAKRLAFDGHDLLRLSARSMRILRGRRIAMILQDPKISLNPTMTVGGQLSEAYRLHCGASGKSAERQALSMLEAVKISDPERVLRCYPFQLSGGMAQRVMIAMMLVGEPDLLIADEATSALDVTVQMAILKLIDELIRQRNMALLMISHDLPLVGMFCDRVLVMRSGNIVEETTAATLDQATHPYTRALLACGPRIDSRHSDLPTVTV